MPLVVFVSVDTTYYAKEYGTARIAFRPQQGQAHQGHAEHEKA